MDILLRHARGELVQKPAECIRKGHLRGWCIFDEKGAEFNVDRLRPISAIETTLAFPEGVWWFFLFVNSAVFVRCYVVSDRYPLGSEERVVTDVVTDFSFEGRDVKEIKEKLQDSIECGGRSLRLPPPLVEAILAVGERAQK
ncbi:MAG: hypothetical protein HY455_00575 [Parcubacteria group bacterium]|nr:hypothetical protein [Parcubacteria group bacterium]